VGCGRVAQGVWYAMVRLLWLTRRFMAARSLEFSLTQQKRPGAQRCLAVAEEGCDEWNIESMKQH
jgi:hypothetical protein